MIEVKNVTKKYGKFIAVDNISFTINEGEIIGLLGPNGAGKSTTMNMITGYLEPTDGEIIILIPIKIQIKYIKVEIFIFFFIL